MKSSLPVPSGKVWLSTLGASAAGIFVCLAFYAFIYLAEPFGAPFFGSPDLTWNDFFTNFLTILAAGLAAFAASVVWKQFGVGETGSVIWFFLAAGLWLWTLGEVLWAAFNLTIVEVPAVSIADIPWVAGYLCFSISLERQYAVIYRPTVRARRLVIYGTWIGMLAAAAFVAGLGSGFRLQADTFSAFVQAFYVLADLTIATLAFLLVFIFRGGAMLRPWLGLFLFALADGLYAWLYESGIYAFTAAAGNLPSLIADTLYVAAYLILAFGLLAHYLLLTVGPAASPKTKK
ncbi:MAG: Uncharacterized protein FD146_1444 [Anaerolineaceae bacterium]|nr:MAG: Uncharacterized protein FD146_1444 [Anaerolineaceae bacterium]